MKKLCIRAISALLLISLALTLVSCISSEDAKASANELFTCLEEGRYEDAVALCHPISGVQSGETFASLADQIKEALGVTFTDGIEIVRYTGFKTSAYESSVDGSRYDLAMEITIGGVTVPAQVVIVDNDDGYGIGGVHFGT